MAALPMPRRTLVPPVGDGTRPAADHRRAWLLTIAYFCIVAVGILNHEMWRDEWQAWMLARDSASLADLLHNMQHEGHPPAWYLLLFGLSRFTRSPAAPQVLNLVIATASVFLLARYSPLPWLYRVLIAFGYFLVFEYGVIARSYALTVLALFVVCTLYRAHRRLVIPLAGGLIVLATVSAYGLILAIAMSLALLYERAGDRRIVQRLRELHVNWKILFVVWLLVSAGAVVVMRPPQGFGGRAAPPDRFTRWGAAETIATLAWAYAPVPDPSEQHMWNTHVVPARGTLWLVVRLGIAIGLLAGGVMLFARTPSVLLAYLTGTGGLLLFQHIFFTGTLRHHGHTFILFLACLWLAHGPLRTWRIPQRAQRLVGVHTRGARVATVSLLLVQCGAGAMLFVADLRGPFSAAPDAARLLVDNELHGLPLAVSPATSGSSIAGILDRPVFYVATQAEGTFIDWGRYARAWDRNLEMPQLRTFIDAAASRESVVVLGAPFANWDPDLTVRELARVEPGLERTEGYVIYHLLRPASP